jgi:hypothetical protein
MRKNRNGTKRWASLVVIAMLASPLTGARAEPISIEPAQLAVGGEAFRGPYPIDLAQVPDASVCGVSAECPEWRVTVDGGGSRLRVALSAVLQELGDVRPWPDFLPRASEMIFGLQILGEAGTVLQSGSTSGAHAVELFLPAPAAGTYTIRVIPESVTDMAFRLRAKLEGPTELTHGHAHGHHKDQDGLTALTPNLRAIPPYEFNFFTPSATYGPGVPVSTPQASCMAEEIAEAAEVGRPIPRLCLRYSMGFENAGDGMFWLSVFCPACQHYYPHTKPVGQAACDLYYGTRNQPQNRCVMGDVTGEPGLTQEGCEGSGSRGPLDPLCWPLTQVRFFSDGSCCRVEPLGSAGVGRFHPTHAHIHYQNAFFQHLFRVSDEGWTPEGGRPKHLDSVGPGGKLGIFPGDEVMADWERFYQHPRRGGNECPKHPAGDHCGMGKGNVSVLGAGEPRLGAGWGDAYEWNRGGNYVSFPEGDLGQPLAGYYVLRVTSDPDRLVIETNEKDNVSYGLIRVSSDGTVELLERGYGTDPWDKEKEIATAVPE